MNSKKLLSVIVPSYNMEAYLAKNISSMMVQDEALRQLVEVIVVNDGSKDRTSEIAHDFAAKYPGCVTVIDKPNGHYGSCINAALPVAKGKYIRMLDADDYANTEAFECFLAYLAKIDAEDESLDLIISNICHVNPDGEVMWQSGYDLPQNQSFTLNSIAETFNEFVGLHAITYRTAMLREMGYRQTEGCPYTDTEWFLLPMSRVRSVRYFDEILMCYLVGRDGQTMQPEIFRRDFPIVIRLVSAIVGQWKGLSSRASLTSQVYVQVLLEQKIVWLYRYCLLEKPTKTLNEALVDFDLHIKDIAPESFVKLLEECTPSHKFSFRYIALWRKSYSTRSPLFRLYYAYVFLVKIYQRLRRNA